MSGAHARAKPAMTRRRNGLHRLEVAIRGNREPGFNHVHTQPVELTGHAQLLLHIHAATRRLLPIPQSGVENRDPCSLHNPMSSWRYPVMVGGHTPKAKLIILQLTLDILSSASCTNGNATFANTKCRHELPALGSGL